MAKRSILFILLTSIFVILAIFWGLFPHSLHCSMLKNIGVTECASHVLHVSIGLIFFIVAIYVRQGNFFNPKNWD